MQYPDKVDLLDGQDLDVPNQGAMNNSQTFAATLALEIAHRRKPVAVNRLTTLSQAMKDIENE